MNDRPGEDASKRTLAEFADECSDLDDPEVMAEAWDQSKNIVLDPGS